MKFEKSNVMQMIIDNLTGQNDLRYKIFVKSLKWAVTDRWPAIVLIAARKRWKKNEKHIGKLIRKNPKIEGAY